MGTTSKYAFPWPAGTDLVNQGDNAIRALAEGIDSKIATDDQGTLAARPVSTAESPGKTGRYYWATDTGQLFRDHGTGWDEIAGKPKVVGNLAGIVPYDGQEIYVLADAANGVLWHFRWRSAGVGAYKWEFLGGPPLYAAVDADQAVPGNSATYVDLSTIGPDIPVPVGGDYDVEIGARWYSSGAGHDAAMSYSVGSTAASDGDAVFFGSTTPYKSQSGSRKRRKFGVGALDHFRAKYRLGVAGDPAADFVHRWMAVTPVRVG